VKPNRRIAGNNWELAGDTARPEIIMSIGMRRRAHTVFNYCRRYNLSARSTKRNGHSEEEKAEIEDILA
jgi:hypothetical protein